jgi:segregation and condensation protein A
MEQKQLIETIFNGDDISWKAMIFEAVRTEEMDPWDIDIAAISSKFMNMLATFHENSLQIPGKVVLASSILLRLKSNKFINEDMEQLDRLIAYTEGESEGWSDDDGEYMDYEQPQESTEYPALIPRTPQPRKRKVSVYDLVKALEKALEVKNRRKILNLKPHPKVELPNRIFDLSMVMNDVYNLVVEHHDNPARQGPLTFSQIIPSGSREDKVYAFIPLLHLCNMQKVDLHQEEHFGDFEIELLTNQKSIASEIDSQLAVE